MPSAAVVAGSTISTSGVSPYCSLHKYCADAAASLAICPTSQFISIDPTMSKSSPSRTSLDGGVDIEDGPPPKVDEEEAKSCKCWLNKNRIACGTCEMK